jgi:hypothetical protein
MKITVVRTSALTEMDGVPVRLWTGQTDSGIRVALAVHRVIVSEQDRQADFERDLLQCAPPGEDHRRPIGDALPRAMPFWT